MSHRSPDTASLSLPPIRHRASSTSTSTNISSALGRRKSALFCLTNPGAATNNNNPAQPTLVSQQTDPLPSLIPPSTNPSMLMIFVSRFLEWVHVQPKHSLAWSTPTTPLSAPDDSLLPVSTPTHKTEFGDLSEKDSSASWWSNLPPIHAPLLFVLLSFPVSTALVFFSLSTLPISLSWPRTLTDLAQLGRELHGYSQSGPAPMAHVIGVMSITAVYKHAWSIPGSVIWNVLAGALFSPAFATVLLTALTTIGSACATLLAKPMGPYLSHFFPKALDMTRSALEGTSGSDETDLDTNKHQSSAWVRLSVLRLIGVVPWSGINIACGVCGVAISDCMLGSFIGSLPWTAVTCQIGDILQTVASTPSPTPQTVSSLLTSPEILAKLVFLSFLSLAPILGRERLRAWISSDASQTQNSSSTSIPSENQRLSRWTWVQDWRSKLHLASRSRTREREQSMKELEVLVQEKGDLERLSS